MATIIKRKARTKKEQNSILPSVLSFIRNIDPTDALMHATRWADDQKSLSAQEVPVALPVQEKTVLGTISHFLEPEQTTEKLQAAIESANIQRIDYCSLPHAMDTLKISFHCRFHGNISAPSGCNSAEFADMLSDAVSDYIKSNTVAELASRYVWNLANARALWRNRIGTTAIKTVIECDALDAPIVINSKAVSTAIFDPKNKELKKCQKLINVIAKAFEDSDDVVNLSVTHYARVGFGAEVYPSQEFVSKSGPEKISKSRILYSVNGVAGIHSQKIGNALRTIDNWYPDCAGNRGESKSFISVESYGSVTSKSVAYRPRSSKADFFSLFRNFVFSESLSLEEQHYVVAMLIRGGVFGFGKKGASK